MASAIIIKVRNVVPFVLGYGKVAYNKLNTRKEKTLFAS
jgi:hypothetical protein